MSLRGGAEYDIAFDEEAYDLSLMMGYEYETDILRFLLLADHAGPGIRLQYASAPVPAKGAGNPVGHDPEAYVCRRLLAESHDGTRVPVTVLHAKDAVLDGSALMLLYGYGSYGFAMPSAFSPHVYSLVDRGFVYAIAHIRGGTENGYGWYLDGKLDEENTFLDFIAAAEYLIAEKFCPPAGSWHRGAAPAVC